MVATPEIPQKAPEGVVERPTEFPEIIEKQPTTSASQPQTQQQNKQDDPQSDVTQFQPPVAKTISIQVPADDDEELTKLAKGPAENSVTWFAVFWLRLIKKAAHFGWKTMFRTASSQPKV